MSMDRCDVHGAYDTDFHFEGCPKCAEAEMQDANREMGLDENCEWGDQ